MATIIEYAATERASFSEKPFCEIDSLVFSQLAMVRMAEIAPLHQRRPAWQMRVRHLAGRLWRRFRTPRGVRFSEVLSAPSCEDRYSGLAPDEVRALLETVAESSRFAEIVIHDYVSVFSEAKQIQFAAMAFTCPGQFTYCAFRGTDRTWVGWKEDFDMAYAAPVPAQVAARQYLNEVGRQVSDPLIVGGHSKGGNLAVYAAAKALPGVAEKITAVYSHDGPGFSRGALSDTEIARIRPLVSKTVPQESLVGLLMEEDFDYRVVESDGRGIAQHSLFKWRVEQGKLVEAGKLSSSARFMAKVLNEWIAGLSLVGRRRAVDALFAALHATGAQDAFDILTAGPKAVGFLVEAARKTPAEARDVIVSEMKSLSSIAARKAGAAAVGVLFSQKDSQRPGGVSDAPENL